MALQQRSSYMKVKMCGDGSCGSHAWVHGLGFRFTEKQKGFVKFLGCPVSFTLELKASGVFATDLHEYRDLFSRTWEKLKYVLIGEHGTEERYTLLPTIIIIIIFTLLLY